MHSTLLVYIYGVCKRLGSFYVWRALYNFVFMILLLRGATLSQSLVSILPSKTFSDDGLPSN